MVIQSYVKMIRLVHKFATKIIKEIKTQKKNILINLKRK